MIFYFSGTGNSQLVAKQIAEDVGDEILSINRFLKEGKLASFHSERPLVFVAPTYAWRMPKVVSQWIRDSTFTGNNNAYFILTCGGDEGNASGFAQKLCDEKGFHFCGLSAVVMPENYVAMFAVPSDGESHAIRERAKPSVAEMSAFILRNEPFPKKTLSFSSRLMSGPINVLYYPFIVKDKGFSVKDTCISCGKCAKRCPLNNVKMVDNQPLWMGHCTHCMACIGGCPVAAIEYKSKLGASSKGKSRYYIMDDSLN